MYANDWQDQAEVFNDFSLQSFAWNFIERPALSAVVAPLLQTSMKILDVGCGSGRIGSWLAESGAQAQFIAGLDISPAMLRIARANHSAGSFVCADIAHPSFNSASNYWVAIAVHVFQHLDPAEFKQALQNLWRTLLPGGHLVFIVGHPRRDLINPSPHRYPKAWRMRITPWGTWVHHFYRSTIDEYLQPTRDAGFSLKSIQVLEPIREGRVNPQLFKEHSELPSRLLVHAMKLPSV